MRGSIAELLIKWLHKQWLTVARRATGIEGAEVLAPCDNGSTPLHQAASSGTAQTIQALLDAGADPNSPQHNGATPLHTAAQFGTPESIKMLLAGGADFMARDKSSDATPLWIKVL